jgi:hypothetical protein
LIFIKKRQFKKGREESLRKDRKSLGGFTLDTSGNSSSYGTKKD